MYTATIRSKEIVGGQLKVVVDFKRDDIEESDTIPMEFWTSDPTVPSDEWLGGLVQTRLRALTDLEDYGQTIEVGQVIVTTAEV